MKALILLLSLISPLVGLAQPKSLDYAIPVPSELEPFAHFQISYEERTLDNGLTELTYSLPATLLGEPQEFRFVGKADFEAPGFSLKAENGEMSCVNNDAGAADCKVLHHLVKVNLDKVKTALDRTSLSPEQKLGHLKLASFVSKAGGDLAGEMNYFRGLSY